MDADLPFVVTADAPLASTDTSFLKALPARARRAIEAARRDGPGASRLLRRSVASYAGEASRHGIPEARFVETVHREILATLTSRVSTEQIARLLDAATEGAMDGYDVHHRLNQLSRVRGHEARFAHVRAPWDDPRDWSPGLPA